MSQADYAQSVEDHQSLLVLVSYIEPELGAKNFGRIYDIIHKVQSVRVQDQQRWVRLRYKRSYSASNNEWGEFQAHRKALGLVCVAKCTQDSQLGNVLNRYEEIKRQYRSTLFDSRLVVFGFQQDGTFVLPNNKDNSQSLQAEVSLMPPEIENFKQTSKSLSSSFESNLNTITEVSEVGGEQVKSSETASNGEERSDSKINRESSKTQVWFYPSVNECSDLKERMEEFALALFWVLESKRLDRTYEKLDKPPLLMTPFERREYNAAESDTNSRTFKKKCLGRLRKHQGDLCLQAGMMSAAIEHYEVANESLKSASDWLWLAGALEGQCASSALMLYPKEEKLGLNRNFSFSVKSGNSTQQPKMKSVNSFIAGTNGLDPKVHVSKNCLAPNDIIDKYKEAIIQYSKYRFAGIIELEASIKACRIMIIQQKYMAASEFLQNVVYINLQLSDEEKIHRYSTLAVLYGEIGFHRKAAFFRRIAALQCVSQQISTPNWPLCYQLMLLTLEGYRITLEPREFARAQSTRRQGWPVIQLRVLHELVYSARKTGNAALAVRHMAFLLQTMFHYLKPTEKTEISKVLESYTEKFTVKSEPIALDSGTIVHSVALSKLPTVWSFRPQPLPGHLEPVKNKRVSSIKSHGPFIYSPINFHTHNKKLKPDTHASFKWIMGHISEVELRVYNPMPTELRVSDMSILSEDLMFESSSISFVLPPESGPHKVILTGKPGDTGELNITGYHSVVLGVPSNCRLRDLANVSSTVGIRSRRATDIKQSKHTIEVVPALPTIQLSTNEPPSDVRLQSTVGHTVSSAMVHLYVGQFHECVVFLTNTSDIPVEEIDVTLDSKIPKDLSSQIFQWNSDNVKSQLPLQPGTSACFTLYITAVDDVVSYDAVILEEVENLPSPLSPRPRTLTVRTHETRPTSPVSRPESESKKSYEALLTFRYSGGPGRTDNYCRNCSMALKLDISPSIYFKKWSVMPDKNPQSCEVCLEILNVTKWDMDLAWTSGKGCSVSSKKSTSITALLPSNLLPSESGSDVVSYSQRIADSLDVRWKLLSLGVEGKTFVDKLTWTPAQLDLLRSSPLDWSVKLCGETYDHEATHSFGRGEPIDLDITVINIGDICLDEISLTVECREAHTGVDALNEDLVTFIGNTRSKHVKVISDESFSQSLSCVLFCAGLYKLHLSCDVVQDNEGKKHKWRFSPDIEINVK